MAIAGAFRSSQDLIYEVLSNLNALAAGQVPDPDDYAFVNEKLDPLARSLAGLQICFWADTNNIPGEWYTFIADIVAGEVAHKFGKSGEELMTIKAAGLGAPAPAGAGPGSGAAAMALKIITQSRATYEVARTEYF